MFVFLLPFFFAYFLFQLKKVERVKECIDFWVDLSYYILDIEEPEDELEELKEKKEIVPEKIEPKYEEKYMEQLNLLDTDFIFTQEEEVLKETLFNTEKEKIQRNIYHFEREIHYLYSEMNKKFFQKEEEEEDLQTQDFDLQEYQEETTNKIQLLEKELDHLKKCEKDDESLYEKAEKNVVEQRLEKLKNSFIMEKTPLGNVVMYYNAKRETFEYYSDSSIPYRFLEVVARKYVTTFHCRPLYVIMEDELKKYEKKLELQKEKQEKQLQIQQSQQVKKPIFAKFKSYNKEAGSGRVNKAPPPKNSIPNTKSNSNGSKNSNEPCILKENANRYTYEGRFSNFNPLQKIERKQVDKKYAISFSDFKKMQKIEMQKIEK
jgi:hypothetical protein